MKARENRGVVVVPRRALESKTLLHQLVDIATRCLYSFHGRFAQPSSSFHCFTFSSRLGFGAAAWCNARHEEAAVAGCEVDKANLCASTARVATARIARSPLLAHRCWRPGDHATA